MSLATPALFGRRALDLTLDAPAQASNFAVSETGFAYFPDEPERFVGRVRELSEARRALSPDSAQRGVVFHDMAGAGKTTCALELAYGYEAGRFEAFVWHKAPDEGADIAAALVALALDMEKQLPGFAMEREQRGGGPLVVRAARSAVPYLLRRQEWGAAGRLPEQVATRDQSLATLAWMLPLLRRIAEATRGTEGEVSALGLLTRALASLGRWQEAEPLLREVAERSAASGQAAVESATLGDLINLLINTGRPREALALVDRKHDATRRAGLGPWTQLADEARRLQLLVTLGENEAVLEAVEELRTQLDALHEQSEQEERVSPWNVRETILDTGRSAALRLKRWEQALALSADRVTSMEARGAPVHELARARYNDSGPLIRLGRLAETRALLDWCRMVFEREQDLGGLGMVFSALANLEDELGRYLQAIAFGETALRYHYALWDPSYCAISHHNLSNYLKRAGRERWVALAHRLAAGVIRLQTGDGRLRSTLRNLAMDVVEFAPEPPPFPGTFDQLCQAVEQVEGVRFRELLERLPRHAADGDEALREVVRMAEAVAEQRRGSAP